jgi:mannose-6-phosphate isomerase
VTLIPLRPVPAPSVRPWAGNRLGTPEARVGEVWMAGPDSIVPGPDGSPTTLDQLAASRGAELVGERGIALLGSRFPLLVKLIDADDWLSLQVHPDDELARSLYGPGAVGKAEAWVVVDAAADTRFVTGPAPELDAEALRASIARGELGLDGCTTSAARRGDTLLLEPGTIHAIGAGAFVYEIEQPSDLTFRISDWGRPTGRALHIDEALRALHPTAHAVPAGSDWALDGGRLDNGLFALELLRDAARRTPAGRSVEVVSALVGGATLRGEGWTERLDEWATAVVPAAVDAYELLPDEDAVIAVGTIP